MGQPKSLKAKRAGDVVAIVVPVTLILILGITAALKPAATQTPPAPPQNIPTASAPPSPSPQADGLDIDRAKPPEALPVNIEGQVGSVRVIPLSEVPNLSKGLKFDEGCQRLNPPLTIAAQVAKDAGWNVSADLEVASYSVVLVDSGYESHPARGCLSRDASLLIFNGTGLLAVVYDRSERTQDLRFNRISQAIDGVRLYDSSGPLADLQLQPGQIRLQSLPDFDLGCDGRVRIPRIEKSDYPAAREALIASGWRPPDPTSAILDFQGCVSAACDVVFSGDKGDTLIVKTLLTATGSDDQSESTVITYPKVESVSLRCDNDIK